MTQDLAYKGVGELQLLYRAEKLSPMEATKAALARLDRVNPALNAFMIVDAERALMAAQRSERRWRDHMPLSPLDGQPVTIKDTLNLQGHPTRSGSRTTPESASLEDSPEAARLKEAGAIILGKTTTPEFGWKGMTDGPLFGTTRNPWNLERTPGGSSGGAAAALAAGVGTLAVGTDGGGSIRIPASYCGLFGIKPTFGRVPHHPHTGPFSTLVCSGPLARCVADAAMMLDELARPDGRDWYALPPEEESFARDLGKGVKGMRIAFSPNFGEAEVEPEIASIVAAAARRFEGLGAQIAEVGAVTAALRPTFENYWLAGFGYTLAQIPAEKHALLDPHFLPLAQRGLAVGKDEYFAGHMARVDLGTRMERFFADWDLLLTPTMPVPPPLATTAYHVQGNDRWAHATPFTVPFNYTGQPAASVPCGITKAGFPVGLQIVGPRFSERRILQAAAAFEADCSLRWPQPAVDRALGT